MNFEIETHLERRVSPLKIDVSLIKEEGTPKTIGEEMFQTKRSLIMRIVVDFWSNDAQLDRKVEQAERTARAHLFKDMLPIVEQIILDSDSSDISKLAGMLKDAMMKGACRR